MKCSGFALGGETTHELQSAFDLLALTPTGRMALVKAKMANLPIHEGNVSKTEISITRTRKGSEEQIAFHTQILIAKEKDPVFQALDLAHELVHALSPKQNPFDPKLNPESYVKQGIEGQGGEADAIAQECKVGKELPGLKESVSALIKARCQYVWQTESDSKKWKHSFYYLGQYYQEFLAVLEQIKEPEAKGWDQKIEVKSPLFSSAVAHKPYPLALLEEYVSITRTICEKSLKTKVGRKIASLADLQSRCHAMMSKDSNGH